MNLHSRLIPLVLLLGACGSGPGAAQGPVVRPGIDVLLDDSLHLVLDRRVAILTNQSGIDRFGVSDIDRLAAAGVQLNAIFSPEHGFRGSLDREGIGHSTDSATGLPIYSLYGETRSPTAAMLEGVDVLLIDLQDIGARSYTYISTAILTMQAAGQYGVTVLVLDRPNPIGGNLMQGPILEDSLRGWGSYIDFPLRHGLSMGEMALFARAEMGIDVSLTVIPAAGWTRSMWYDDTGLIWIRPSPNMPDLESATHYPGLVPFERTNLSVGRGTPVAFQVVGAPWLDPHRVIATLGPVPGLDVVDTVFTPETPTDGKYDGVPVPGLRLRVTDREVYDPIRFSLALLAAVKDNPAFSIQPPGFDRRMGRASVRIRILAGEPAESVWASLGDDLVEFRRRVEPFLLYP